MEAKAKRLSALEVETADPAFWANQDRARQLVQEMKTLKGWVAPAEEITRRLQDAYQAVVREFVVT